MPKISVPPSRRKPDCCCRFLGLERNSQHLRNTECLPGSALLAPHKGRAGLGDGSLLSVGFVRDAHPDSQSVPPLHPYITHSFSTITALQLRPGCPSSSHTASFHSAEERMPIGGCTSARRASLTDLNYSKSQSRAKC